MTAPLLSLRYTTYYGTVFLALGVYLPFWPLWLGARGLTAEEIGLVLALASWIKILSVPLFGQLADRRWGARRTTLVAALWSLASFAAFLISESFWPILAVQLLWAFAFNALVPLGESQAMVAATKRGLDYGRMRLWGSITFILGALGAGELIGAWSPSLLFWFILAALAATLAGALLLPGEDGRPHAPLKAERLTQLLANRRFVTLLAAAGLLQASHAVYYGFSAIHWRAAGHSAATVGWLWAEGVIAEILLFAVSAPLLKRLGPTGLLALGGAAGLLRWGLLATTSALPLLVGAQLLHALTFGAAHLGTLHLIVRTAPPSLAATAQALNAAISGGLIMGLAILGAGALYADYGGGAYWAAAGLSLAGLAFVGLLAWQSKGRQEEG